MTWRIEASQGFESRKIKYLLPKYTRGRVLEIGCGAEKAYQHFIGYDSGHHFGKGAADVIGDASDLSIFANEVFDAVFSSHTLEHIEDMQKAINEWCRVIKPNGYLCLYLPSENLYPKCGEDGANPDHKHNIGYNTVSNLLKNSGYDWIPMEFEERDEGNEYSFFEVYQKTDNIQSVSKKWLKTACVVRYGGFGDMLQCASILPPLKEQGYHITVMTTPKGKEIIKNDPHVDDWYIQDTDQVPNEELVAFWSEQAKRFDKFINLSESIEGTLLAIPGRVNHSWSSEVRHRRMNLNYYDWTAELAGVEFEPCKLFYPTEEEEKNITLTTDKFTVVWALAGSSAHKFSPHMDAVIARMLLEIPEIAIYLVGDEACKILEQGWEDEYRVLRLSGELSIRKTLTLAQSASLVIGAETGVLNSVAHERNAKVIMLSHSSKKNLTQHWYNTITLTPRNCSCYPCHRMHYTREFCPDTETGASLCMTNIPASDIWEAVHQSYKQWRKRK